MPVFHRFVAVVLSAVIVRFRTQSLIREGLMARELRYQSYGFNGIRQAHEHQAVTIIRDNENRSHVHNIVIAIMPRLTYD